MQRHKLSHCDFFLHKTTQPDNNGSMPTKKDARRVRPFTNIREYQNL